MPAPSPIFVAGTGRSGTSQLGDILGEHPQIHRIPIETHFIVDPGGLRDLADALTIRYDPIVGDDALRRLSDVLEAAMVHIKRHPVTVVASHVDQPWAPPTVDGNPRVRRAGT